MEIIDLRTKSMRDFINDSKIRSKFIMNYVLTNGNDIFEGGHWLENMDKVDYNGEKPAFETSAQIMAHFANNPKREGWLNEIRQRDIQRILDANRAKERESYTAEIVEAAWAGKTEICMKNPAYHTKEEVCELFGLTFVRNRHEDYFIVRF